MALDTFQKAMESIVAKFKVGLMDLLEQGIKHKLDEELMLAIVNREIEKLQESY